MTLEEMRNKLNVECPCEVGIATNYRLMRTLIDLVDYIDSMDTRLARVERTAATASDTASMLANGIRPD